LNFFICWWWYYFISLSFIFSKFFERWFHFDNIFSSLMMMKIIFLAVHKNLWFRVRKMRVRIFRTPVENKCSYVC
jgi:hypothetical protein